MWLKPKFIFLKNSIIAGKLDMINKNALLFEINDRKLV